MTLAQLQARLRREILENSGNSSQIQNLQRQIDALTLQNVDTETSQARQPIQQEIRNTDHNHSVDTWFNSTPISGNQQHEAANVYTFPPLEPLTINDAVINSGSNVLTSASNPFTSAMIGRFVIITGAGVSGDKLSGEITAFTNSGQVTLSVNASTSVSGASAKINLQKLTKRNSKNTVGSVNDALKASSHSNYSSNITDPDWDKNFGIVRLGSKNIVVYPFGFFQSNGTTFVPLHQIFAGRTKFFRLNYARGSKYVKAKGRLFVGLYNNYDKEFDFIKGANLSLSGMVAGNPSTTVSTQYLVVLQTGQGYTVVSDVLTINAPDTAGFNNGAVVNLSWANFAGTILKTLYRKQGTGNVFKIDENSSGSSEFTDNNPATRIDTGTTSFPTFTNLQPAINSYWASTIADNGANELNTGIVNGEGTWTAIEAFLPVASSVNMGTVFDPHLVIGLTEPLATELTDVVTNSTVTVTSAAGQFTSLMVGKAFTLTNRDNLTEMILGTVSAVTNSTTVVLSVSATWTGTNNTLVIDDSQPRGLLFDLVGISATEGEWAFHADDNSELRGQPVAANPNGSTQGNTTGSNQGGTGGVRCLENSTRVIVKTFDGHKSIQIGDLTLSDEIFDGFSAFQKITKITRYRVAEILRIQTADEMILCTETHRFVSTSDTFAKGFPAKSLKNGSQVLTSNKFACKLQNIISIEEKFGDFEVTSIELEGNHLFYADGFVSHNAKIPSEII
jgi:hypothetical protein